METILKIEDRPVVTVTVHEAEFLELVAKSLEIHWAAEPSTGRHLVAVAGEHVSDKLLLAMRRWLEDTVNGMEELRDVVSNRGCCAGIVCRRGATNASSEAK